MYIIHFDTEINCAQIMSLKYNESDKYLKCTYNEGRFQMETKFKAQL